jgi:D-alanyl-D-alanine dipeptidase
MTGETLPGVPDAPLVRLDVARRLKQVDEFLRTDEQVREVLGAPAHLRIDDALRPLAVQKFAYEVAWPTIIKRMNPEITDEQLAIEIPKYVAKPNENITPTPHLTGGAVDVALMNMETGQAFDRGHKGGAIKGTAYPDFHEGYHLNSHQSDIEDIEGQAEVAPKISEIVISRRVLYWAMAKAGLHVNPNEIWHYGKGDPLSEYVSGSHHPYYGIAELPEWYTEEMNRLRQN